MVEFSLRAATQADLLPMMAIGHEGLRPHIEAYKSWDQAAEEAGFRAHFVPELIEIVEVEDQAVGYIKVETRHDHVYVDGVYLAHSHRGLGIGSQLLRNLMKRSHAQGLPVRLRVLRTNPAQHLYLRLGFEAVAETTDAIVMQA